MCKTRRDLVHFLCPLKSVHGSIAQWVEIDRAGQSTWRVSLNIHLSFVVAGSVSRDNYVRNVYDCIYR